jgi:hypothetical protein
MVSGLGFRLGSHPIQGKSFCLGSWLNKTYGWLKKLVFSVIAGHKLGQNDPVERTKP